MGFKNYIDILSQLNFWKANGNNLIILILLILIFIPLSLILALVLDHQGAGLRRFFKISSVLPSMLSITVAAQMWVAIYEPQWGLLNSFLKAVHLEGLANQWLSNVKTVMPSIAIPILWQYIGFNMLIFYAGVKSIPKSYYEAALIDGAGFLKSSWHITIPLLQDVTRYILTISVLGIMAQFAHVRVMTAGGPGGRSETVIYQLYHVAFNQMDFGKGCAIAVLFVLECLILTFVINSLVAKEKIEF